MRVSNRLAALAAFLLVAASLATGMDRSSERPVEAGASVAARSAPALDRARTNELGSVKANKGFKVRLYLFRRN
ncbi:MAG: hypothetical protein KJO70_02180 [Gammaproteobacteria bacterium]|nr:hypothetical protein [Gammaproteobacteria bacterium]MBT8049977.1 hypothetical protein [Gammaproteobacteria bacterium]NNJ79693.1 hypothetical protein [Xanthomonadales bacterium]